MTADRRHSVGFVGTGAIGAPMAWRLVEAGYSLVVCDADPSTLVRFADAGVGTSEKASDCAGRDVVIFMVADDAQLTTCIHGPSGILANPAAPRRPAVFIVMSTVRPSTIRSIAEVVAPLGIRIIDAPVSGGPVAAAAGRLSVMVGGDPAAIEDVSAILGAMGSAIHRCGELGSGALTKIVNNLVGVTTLMLLAEALQLARRSGLDLRHLTTVMEASSGRSAGSADWDRTREILAEFASDLPRVASFLRTNRKDMALALELGANAGVAMPILQSAFDAVELMSDAEVFERLRSAL